MKKIDKINLIDRIARELQSKMTYSDINNYLSAFGINIEKVTSDNGGSKWVYSKELLASEPDELILKIANELEINHNYSSMVRNDVLASTYWKTNHFRLFLSHLSSFKETTSQLQEALKAYGISSFVAHEDIDPTREWQDEIEKALFSMDALAAILTPKFNESNWTDQEVGVAIGRDILIISIRRGMDPYGFIGKYQGLQTKGKTVAQVAESLFKVIANHPKTKEMMAKSLSNQIISSLDTKDAIDKLALLRGVEALPLSHLEGVRENCQSNSILTSSKKFTKLLNEFLYERGIQKLAIIPRIDHSFDDDIPF